MSEIYKVLHINKNKKTLYIFHPFRDLKDRLQQLFSENPKNQIFSNIFDSYELDFY